MAEGNKSNAKSELGQLFLDIGSTGLGSLIKGLNTVSASFMLTKKAAESFTKPIINMSKTATQSVIGLDKIHSITGLTIDELQRLQVWTKLNNVSFGDFIGQLQGAQQKIMDVKSGMAAAPAGLSMLGLDLFEFDAHDPIGFLNAVMAKVNQVDEVTGSALLRWLGLSEDLRYTYNQGNQVFDERLLLNERELENLRKQQSAWNTLGVSLPAAFSKWIANQDKATRELAKLTNDTSGLVDVINDDLAPALGIIAETLITITIFAARATKWIADKLAKAGEKIGDVWGTISYNLFGGGNIDTLNSSDWAELSKNPEKMKKYLAARDKMYQEQADAEKTYKEERKKAEEKARKQENIKPKENHTQFSYSPKNPGTSSSQTNNNFGLRGSQLIPAEPIDDFSVPQAVNSYTVPALPPSLQGGNNAAMTTPPTSNINNNISFEINQTITGDNPQQIAAASANAIDEASLNILQAQNQWAV